MNDDVRTVLRFLSNRLAAVSVAEREKVQAVLDKGEVTLYDVVQQYIEHCRRA